MRDAAPVAMSDTTPTPKIPSPDKLCCYCLGVTYGEVEQVVREHGCRTVEEVTRRCRAGGGCRSCHVDILDVLERVRREDGAGLLARLLRRLGFGRSTTR